MAVSTAPGPSITRITNRTAPLGLTDTATYYCIGLADRGPVAAPAVLTSMSDYANLLGLRTSANGDDNSLLYDSLDGYFAIGGSRAVVQRYVGPAAVTASIALLDGSSGTVATVKAASPGAWANGALGGLTFTVQTNSEDTTIPSGSFVVIVYLNAVEVERSPVLANKAALLQWAPATAGGGQSQYLALTSGASALIPAATIARALASGVDDRASATTTQQAAALALLTADMGPGQEGFPGATTAAAHALVQTSANNHGRVAVLDMPDTATIATATAVAATDRGQTGNDVSGAFWPWVVIPGLTSGTRRTIPPSAVAAALMARSDNSGHSPNEPAAGDNGDLGQYVLGLSQAPVADSVRATLNTAGINPFVAKYGGYRLYGYRTLADPTTNPDWINLANSRMFGLLSARLNLLAETFEFDEITNAKVAEFQAALLGVLGDYYSPNGPLFGATFSDAARVDVSIDTPTYLAGMQLGATAEVRLAPFAERVQINLRKVNISTALSA